MSRACSDDLRDRVLDAVAAGSSARGAASRFGVGVATAVRRLAAVIDKTDTAGDVWADTAYRSKADEKHLEKNGLKSEIHFRRKPGRNSTGPLKTANRAGSQVPSAVEGVFAHEKSIFGLFVRTIGLAGARTGIGPANLACNVKRYFRITTRAACRRMKSATGTTPQHRQGQNDRTQSSNIDGQNSATHPTKPRFFEMSGRFKSNSDRPNMPG